MGPDLGKLCAAYSDQPRDEQHWADEDDEDLECGSHDDVQSDKD